MDIEGKILAEIKKEGGALGMKNLKQFGEESEIKAALSNLQKKRSEEHTSELQSRLHLVCRLLLEQKNPSGRTNR